MDWEGNRAPTCADHNSSKNSPQLLLTRRKPQEQSIVCPVSQANEHSHLFIQLSFFWFWFLVSGHVLTYENIVITLLLCFALI